MERYKRYMVQKLKTAQVPVKQIQELTGMSERTIGRIAQEPAVTTNDDAALRQARKVGRRSTVAQYEAQLQQWLAAPHAPEDGPLQSQEVLARLRAQDYMGGRTAVYAWCGDCALLKPQCPSCGLRVYRASLASMTSGNGVSPLPMAARKWSIFSSPACSIPASLTFRL